MRALFWIPVALLAWAQAGYGLFLAALRRAGAPAWAPPAPRVERPRVTLVVAAYSEQAVIADKVANAIALDWPRDRLQVIVAVDGGAEAGADTTAARAREAGADVVLELARGGKYRAQAAAVGYATGELLAFSDANSIWEPEALVHLAAAFEDPAVGYACGQGRFVNESGSNQVGLYWRYEMWLREHESALASVTAGNGAIYAVRPDAFRPIEGHDLALPFSVVKDGRRAVYVPAARASEKMVPTVEGEWARKRRMMSYAWPIVVRGGLIDPRGYSPLYALRRSAYMHVDAVMGHDLSFPFNVVKRGRRAVYAPEARATEKMVPSIEGEWARKRRMTSHAWAIVLGGGLLSPRGYSPLYALMLLSHRVLRYASPLLHLAAAAATLALLREGPAYRAAALAQAGLLGAAAAGGRLRVRPLLLARYYVATTAALGAGLYDHLRHGTPAVWEAAEGTR